MQHKSAEKIVKYFSSVSSMKRMKQNATTYEKMNNITLFIALFVLLLQLLTFISQKKKRKVQSKTHVGFTLNVFDLFCGVVGASCRTIRK